MPTGTYQYAYSATSGNLSSITAPGANTLSYVYDGSLLTSTTWAGIIGGSVSRAHDGNFRMLSQSVNGGNTITFGYDQDSLLTSAGTLTITRHPQHGRITDTSLNVVADSRSYNSFAELTQYTAAVSGTTVFDVRYTRVSRPAVRREFLSDSRVDYSPNRVSPPFHDLNSGPVIRFSSVATSSFLPSALL